MKVSKNFCVEAKNAFALLNKQFNPQPVYVKPIKNKKYHDNFSRTLSDPDCAAAKALSDFKYKKSVPADYYASGCLGTDFITDDKISKLIDFLKEMDVYKTKKARSQVNFSVLFQKENQNNLLASLSNLLNMYRRDTFRQVSINPQKGRFFNLEELQAFEQFKCEFNKKSYSLRKLFNDKSKNPKVIQIEKELVEGYGIKRAFLNDDLPQAQAILAAVKSLKSEGYPLADEYLVSNFGNGILGEFMRVDSENIVILPTSDYVNGLKEFCKANNRYLFTNFLDRMHFTKNAGLEPKVYELNEFFENNKTPESDSLLWTAVHETLHIGERSFTPTSERKLPKRFIPAAMDISSYAYLSNTKELFTELLSDKLINKNLSPAKEALLKFLNNGDR